MRVTSMIDEMAAKAISSNKKENEDGDSKPKIRKPEKNNSSISGHGRSGDSGIGSGTLGKTGLHEGKTSIDSDSPREDDTTETIDG